MQIWTGRRVCLHLAGVSGIAIGFVEVSMRVSGYSGKEACTPIVGCQ